MKLIKIFILSILGLIVITEIFLRIAYYEQLKLQKFPLIYRPDSLIGYSHIPNIKATICRPSIKKDFKLNNHGFIGNDFSTNKENGKIRIAIVGNSMTEGIWYNSDENYVMKLQKAFHNNGYKEIEIINCSIGGINKDLKNYLHIKNYVSKFNPDIILFNVEIPFNNDNEVRDIYKNYMIRYARGSKWSKQKAIESVDKLSKHKGFILLYNLSYIFRAYCKKYSENNYGEFSGIISTYRENSSSAPDILTFQYSLRTSIKLLSDLNIYLENNHIKLIVWPIFFNQEISGSLKENKILYINAHINRTHSDSYKHDSHLNEQGHEKITRALYPKLLEKLKDLNFLK